MAKVKNYSTKNRFIRIFSRHPSCSVLRKKILTPHLAIYRHGSTSLSQIPKEVNSVVSVNNSASKLLMKRCFDVGKVKHLPWMNLQGTKTTTGGVTNGTITILFPIVIKSNYGSRGKGNYKIDDSAGFEAFLKAHNASGYIVEQYFSGAREYRVHVTAYGPVYSLRKLLKDATPKEKRWVRNDETCVWITEFQQSRDVRQQFLGFRNADNEHFDRPANWDVIVKECVKALNAVGLDIGAVDLKVQSSLDKEGKQRKNPDFFIIEINSAPSLGTITAHVYKEHLPKVLKHKYDTVRTG